MVRFHRAAGLTVAALLGSSCADPLAVSLATDRLILQVIEGLDPRRLAGDAVTIEAASLDGSTLRLDLQYGGGCREHRFALVAGTEFGESNPLFAVARLAHEGGRDPCDAMIRRSVTVDLRPIIPWVERAGGRGAVRILLLEPGDRVARVEEIRYTF